MRREMEISSHENIRLLHNLDYKKVYRGKLVLIYLLSLYFSFNSEVSVKLNCESLAL